MITVPACPQAVVEDLVEAENLLYPSSDAASVLFFVPSIPLPCAHFFHNLTSFHLCPSRSSAFPWPLLASLWESIGAHNSACSQNCGRGVSSGMTEGGGRGKIRVIEKEGEVWSSGAALCKKPQGQTYFFPLKPISSDPIFKRYSRKTTSTQPSGKMFLFLQGYRLKKKDNWEAK